MNQAVISIIVAIVGCFIGLAGWLGGRDKKIASDGEWRGATSQDLKDIKDGVSGIGERLAKMEGKISDHESRISVIENKMDINGR